MADFVAISAPGAPGAPVLWFCPPKKRQQGAKRISTLPGSTPVCPCAPGLFIGSVPSAVTMR